MKTLMKRIDTIGSEKILMGFLINVLFITPNLLSAILVKRVIVFAVSSKKENADVH